MDPILIIFNTVRLIAVVSVAVIGIVFFSFLKSTLEIKDIERATMEIAENVVHHNLVESRVVFDEVRLDQYDGTPVEPYFRHCRYGYHVALEDFDTTDNTWKVRWQFGYKPAAVRVDNAVLGRTYPAALGMPDPGRPAPYYDNARHLIMKLDVYDTWFARMTCMVENAYRLKKEQRMLIDGSVAGIPDQPFGIDRSADSALCLFAERSGSKAYTGDCRYVPEDIPFHPFYYNFVTPRKTVPLAAVPVKAANVGNLIGPGTALCTSILPAWRAGPTDDVGAIALCICEQGTCPYST
ncbi:MAG: hypothetical protein HYY37_02350 [Candidatus Aenigmarchaeota archaeon]|nr:hypothetical protein [Candidatus Aenigmarchaeota archaeon]